MKNRLNPTPLQLAMLTGLMLTTSTAIAQDNVEYAFEFIAEWSEATHPPSIPNNRHFSGVIGGSHNADAQIWAPGEIASDGIERMAESGETTTLHIELLSYISAGNADSYYFLGDVQSTPGVRLNSFSMNKDFPLISLVTMVAPSPDWFVGVHDVDLRPNGVWVQELIFELDPYDSGTDSGVNYVSVNADITPHIPIENIKDRFPFEGTPRLGTFRFTLISDAGCSLADIAEPYGELNFFDVSAFLAAFTAQDPIADINDDGEYNFFDVSDFLTQFTAGCP